MKSKYLLAVDLIRKALMEDAADRDVTTDALIDVWVTGDAKIYAKAKGVLAGDWIGEMVFREMDANVRYKRLKQDGDQLMPGDVIAELTGSLSSILKAERTALNFLQHLSGIATRSAMFRELASPFKVRITDTRKTTPGLRILEKYAVRVGGCHNHRHSLSDGVLIKENHIKTVGDIGEAVRRCRAAVPHTVKIEIEVTDLNQLKEALAAGADIILLDNMDVPTMLEAVRINGGKALLEASGNVTEENLARIAGTGVDIISLGTLTHSTRALDMSLLISRY
jgi:nicotinate-nucleotide pyrophosphorylase (carboxylating)